MEKEMWMANFRYGGRWRRQHKTELDGVEWSVAWERQDNELTFN